MGTTGGRVTAGLVMVAAALSPTACSSGPPAASPNGSTTTARPAATGPAASASTAATAPSTTAAPTTAGSTTLVPMQPAKGGEFLSPSGNISCEVDYHRAGLTQVYCQTVTPPRSVTMGAAGTYTTCTGQQCIANPGTGTPTLAYGTATGVGPFRCESATTGVTCIADDRGFRISASGITPVSG